MLNRLYGKSLEHLVLPLGERLLDSPVMKHLHQLRSLAHQSETELLELEHSNLERLLQTATQTIPYYRSLSPTKNADPTTWLRHFPVLKKADLIANESQLLGSSKSRLIACNSSGSSGVQSTVYVSREDQAIARAVQLAWWEWAGYSIGDPIVQNGMTPKRGIVKKLKDILLRTTYYTAFNLSDADSVHLLNSMRNTSTHMLCGYASALYVLAHIAEQHGIDDVRFTRAISWGDKLFPHYRQKILDVFGAQTFDTYACTEHVMIAAQADLEYKYILSPYVHLELLDENDQPVEDGKIGRVVVTRLFGTSMPLIRLDLGDLAIRLPRSDYPKNRQMAFPLLKHIVGRDTDIVTTPEGHFLIVHYFTGIFEHYPQIKQFKVVQNEPDGMDIEYIPREGFDSEVLKRVEDDLRHYLQGENFRILFKEVDFIAPSASGKPQFIEVNLKNNVNRLKDLSPG